MQIKISSLTITSSSNFYKSKELNPVCSDQSKWPELKSNYKKIALKICLLLSYTFSEVYTSLISFNAFGKKETRQKKMKRKRKLFNSCIKAGKFSFWKKYWGKKIMWANNFSSLWWDWKRSRRKRHIKGNWDMKHFNSDDFSFSLSLFFVISCCVIRKMNKWIF